MRSDQADDAVCCLSVYSLYLSRQAVSSCQSSLSTCNMHTGPARCQSLSEPGMRKTTETVHVTDIHRQYIIDIINITSQSNIEFI